MFTRENRVLTHPPQKNSRFIHKDTFVKRNNNLALMALVVCGIAIGTIIAAVMSQPSGDAIREQYRQQTIQKNKQKQLEYKTLLKK